MVAYSPDPVVAPKVATDFAKQNDKFVVLGGTIAGSTLDAKVSRPWPTCPRLMNSGRGSLACSRPRNPPRGGLAGSGQPAGKGTQSLCRQEQCSGRVTINP